MTKDFPKDELFGLSSQMRRSAVSVASNIAEGKARESKGEFRQFPGVPGGSSAEVETQLVIAAGLGIGDEEKRKICGQLAGEVSKMPAALRASVKEPEGEK